MGQHLQNVACLQITYVYNRNQGLDAMSRYETLAMDEMQKDFLGLNTVSVSQSFTAGDEAAYGQKNAKVKQTELV